MDSQVSLQVTIPTDDDGFVRQECPSCGREFKAATDGDDLVTPAHCPYCGHQDEQWFTAEQTHQFEAQTLAATLPQIEKELAKAIRGVNRSSGGLVKMSIDAPDVDVPVMTPEGPDMCVTTSPCCGAAVKIDDDWNGITFCTACGDEYEVG